MERKLADEAGRAVAAAMQLAIQRHRDGDLNAAEALYGNVLIAAPRHAQALHNLSLIRLSRGDAEAALVLLTAAVAESPDAPTFNLSLGRAREAAGDLVGAAEAYRQVLRLDRHSAAAQLNLGNVLREMGQPDEAEVLYRQALDDSPLNTDIAVQLAVLRLSREDFSAWREYEWRHWSAGWLKLDKPCLVPLPKWDGGDIHASSLLLYGEQGIGDEIMFASLVTEAAALADRTVLLCEPRLRQLFSRSFPNVTVEAQPPAGLPFVLDPRNSCDLRCSLASLPRLLRGEERDFTGAAYLFADAVATGRWRQRLSALGGTLKVGLSWRGGAIPRTREARSIALESLAPLFDVDGVRFVNLQYGAHDEEIAAFNATVGQPLVGFDDIDPLRDMDGFAALLSALDCVITVDNSTVHLAGALGVPTFLLCPFNANWRWTHTREDSLWYRSLRLFRQVAPGHAAWTPVISGVADALREAVPRVPALQPATADTTAVLEAANPSLSAPSVLLLNDTAYWYHWGCTGTSLALHEHLRAAGHAVDSLPIMVVNSLAPLPATAAELDDEDLYLAFCRGNPALIARIQAVSQVIVNGEGSIHGLGQTARALLYLAWLAKRRFGKPTSIVNHSCYPHSNGANPDVADEFYRRVYQVLDSVAVREEHSAAALARLGIETTESFDCLPLFIADHRPAATARSQRRVVVAGSVQLTPPLVTLLATLMTQVHDRGYRVEVLVGANACLAPDDVRLMTVLHPRVRGRYTLVAATSEREWLATLSGADLLISGRFHHSIAAACLGTPFVVAASNTQKIDGLIRRLGLSRDAVWISPADVAQASARVDSLLQDPQPGLVSGQTLAKLQALAGQNFAGLVPATRPWPWRSEGRS
jgi:polysaccharide pyruvyl transferase WcaK-like protein/tetratricopeptide (TPR) repeat protein